jgi:hypothetical protein
MSGVELGAGYPGLWTYWICDSARITSNAEVTTLKHDAVQKF